MPLNIRKHKRTDIDKIYLYVKDSFESEYQLIINGGENLETIKMKNSNTFIDY